MQMRTFLVSLGALMLILAAGCEKAPEDTPAPAKPPPAETEPAAAPQPETAPDAPAQEPPETLALEVPNRGALHLVLPKDMQGAVADSDVPGAAAARLEGSETDPQIVHLTVLGVPGMYPRFGDDTWLAEELERWKSGLPNPEIAEDAAPVDFQLDNVRGIYLNLEDPAPESDAFPYVLQGFFNVDGCIVSFQALHREPRASAANQFLALLVDADWQPLD